jgi:hypothetical protein
MDSQSGRDQSADVAADAQSISPVAEVAGVQLVRTQVGDRAKAERIEAAGTCVRLEQGLKRTADV